MYFCHLEKHLPVAGKTGFAMIHVLLALLWASGSLAQQNTEVQRGVGYQVLETLDHNESYFTQGLELSNQIMYESSGRYGKSKVRKYLPQSDKTLLEISLADKYFAEGLTIIEDEVFLLTWKENTLLVLDKDTLQKKRQLTYEGEGWGLAGDGRHLIMSNGSNKISFRNPETFAVEREVEVYFKQHTVRRINELEFAQGYLWANIWFTPMIIKINPATGEVVEFFDLTDVVKQHTTGNDERVLNGIAYDPQRQAYWVTGKLWPKRYLIKFN